jgi:two-component system, cell cycle sensor histidine kinase and response regulator CckA
MTLSFPSRFHLSDFAFRFLWVAGALAVIGGTVWISARRADRELRTSLLQEARMVAGAVNLERVGHLTGTADDLAVPDYVRLKEQLASVRAANSKCRFIYLMGRRSDGVILILLDSEPFDSSDYSPPGQAYDEATEATRATVGSGQEAVEGPSSDRWGVFVSAYVPLPGLLFCGAPIMLGMDVTAQDWNWTVASHAVLPATLATIAVMLGLLAALLQRRRHENQLRNEQLRKSEESYRTQFAGNSVPMLLIDPGDGAILDANAAAQKFYGYPPERIRAMRITDINLLPPAEVRQIMGAIQRDQGRQFQFQHRLADGSVREVEVSSSLIQFGARLVLHSIIHDVTDRKQADARIRALLAESNQARLALLSILEDQMRAETDLKRLAAAIEQAAEAIVVTDVRGLIEYVNPAFEAVTGYTRAEAVGQNPRILQSGQQDAAFYRAMWTTLTSGQTWRGRFTNKRKDGVLFIEDAVLSPVSDAAGKIVNFVAVKHDVTERLRLSDQLQQAQKMELVGRLAGGVAHDFNNILTVILGQADLAIEQVDPALPAYASLDEIRKAAVRSTHLTRQLLAFARKQTISPQIVDLNETVEDMFKLLRRLIGENIDLDWRPQSHLWPVKVDPAQIGQVLTNLCVNARDAIAGSGHISIETENVAFDEAYCRDHADFIPGEFVQLAVGDTGIGMDPETLVHVFEPFFTTKEVGKGTGLGLATAYGIAKQSNGFIHVESEPGQGTTFRVYLPRYLGQVDLSPKPVPAGPPARGHENLLLVEDDPAILKMAVRMAESLGYSVLAANSPDEAIRLAQAHAGDIHLLMTDIVMPGMNGRVLAQTLQARYPNLKLLFMSGYTADIIAHNGVLEEGIQFIQKPYSIHDLAAKLRAALASGKK